MNQFLYRRWLLLWLVLAAFVAVRATARPDHRGVLLDHLEFGRRLLHGTDVYADWRSDPDAPLRPLHAPYPPSFGLLTAPFAVVADTLGLRAARLAWALLQVLLIAALLWALRRIAGGGANAAAGQPPSTAPPRDGTHPWLALGSLLILARFVLRDTHGGGGNLINVALCTLAFLAAERGRPAASGWLLGVSLVTKPTQVWLVAVLWLLGHRRAVGHTVLAAAACTLATATLLQFDLAPWQRWLHGSLALGAQSDAFAVPALGFPEFEWMNQSLRSAAARWISTVPPEFAARVALGVPPGLGLDAAAAAWVARLVTACALVALLVVAARRRTGGPRCRAFVFAAALVFSLLASPLSWKPHHVALLPLVYLLLDHATRARSRATWVLLGAFVLCCAIGQQFLGDDGDEFLNSLYLLPLFDLLLLAAALWLARPGCAPPADIAIAGAVATPMPPR